MKSFLIRGSAAAAILIGGVAFAATTEAPQTAKTTQPAHKVHHRGVAQPIKRTDVQARIGKAFAKLDANHDGAITKDEANAIGAKREHRIEKRAEGIDPAKAFARLDANHDGSITTAETQAARNQRIEAKGGKPVGATPAAFSGIFARADSNKDNVLTRTEFDMMGQRIKTHMEKVADASGEIGSRFFDRTDTNKDGKVSLGEMEQVALANFDRADVNHDGTVTPQERLQLRQAAQAKRKAQ